MLCPACGKNLALVGRVHNCVAAPLKKTAPKQAGTRHGIYRDLEKRKKYQREWVRRHRGWGWGPDFMGPI